MEGINWLIGILNTALWSYILIFMLIGIGLYFTVKSGLVQFTLFKEMFRLLSENTSFSKKKKNISPFQAFCISAASRVGTGNLAGVALAIAVGGPGAIFWMWIIALIGAASAFVESTLAQIYKIKSEEGFQGGPAYYMQKAIHNGRWIGVLFAILITLCFGLAFNSIQSNTIAEAFEKAFNMDKFMIGLIISILTGLVIFGGVKRIAYVSSVIVPIMSIIYVVLALVIVIMNITEIPAIIGLIFKSAFGVEQVVGGGIGVAMLQGIKRGLFSNEAGMGSAPNAAATATTSHPVKQGLIQTLGVFFDTILVCNATAFVILISGVYIEAGSDGIKLTQDAISSQVGSWGTPFVAVCILLISFSSIIGNYYYGETNIEFINNKDKKWILIYRISVVGMVLFGAVQSLSMVWNLGDLFMGLMAIVNLAAIVYLGNIAFSALKDYIKQKMEGKDPIFRVKDFDKPANIECWDDK